MNTVDAALAAVLCVFAARGYVKGLFREVFALLGLAAGFIVSVQYHQQVSFWFDFWPYSPLVLQGIVLVLLFLLVYIATKWVGHVLHRSTVPMALSGYNRFGGLLAGGSRGALFLGVGLFFVASQSWVPQSIQPHFDRATLVAPLSGFGAWVVARGSAVEWPGASEPDSTADDPQREA